MKNATAWHLLPQQEFNTNPISMRTDRRHRIQQPIQTDYTLATDGSANNQNRRSALAFVLVDHIFKDAPIYAYAAPIAKCGIAAIAESLALREGIKQVPEGCSVRIITDSQNLMTLMTLPNAQAAYRQAGMFYPLLDGKSKEKCDDLRWELYSRRVIWQKVTSHSATNGHPLNRYADALARQAMNQRIIIERRTTQAAIDAEYGTKSNPRNP